MADKRVVLASNGKRTIIDMDFCDHQHTEPYTFGQMYFTGGELIDTIETVTRCLDCGAILDADEPEADSEIPY